MASMSSLNSLSLQHHLHYFTAQPKKGNLGGRKCHVLCSTNIEQHSQTTTNDELKRHGGAKRREILLQTALSAFCFQAVTSNANAETGSGVLEGYQEYVDDVNKFKIFIPQDWQVGVAEPDGFKSVTAFYPKEDTNSNVSVAITGIGPDFTKMGSFGKVEEFAESLVNGLDRSWRRPPGVAAKLISCKDSKGFYYIEYSLQNPGESRRHIFSAIGMASNGWYNRLYTVTGQFIEDETKYSSEIEEAVSSFRFT